MLPVNQVVTPLGTQVELPGLRPQALALSPNGQLLAVSGKTAEVLILDPATGAVRHASRFGREPRRARPAPRSPISSNLAPRGKSALRDWFLHRMARGCC